MHATAAATAHTSPTQAKAPGSAPFVPHWEVLPDTNAGYDKVGVPGHKAELLGNATTADGCLSLCKEASSCQEFAWKIFGPHPPPVGPLLCGMCAA